MNNYANLISLSKMHKFSDASQHANHFRVKKNFEKFTFLTLGEQKLGRRNCSAIERLITVIPTVGGGVIGPRRLLCNHNSYMITGNQSSKLTLANSQNAGDFDNLRVRKISISKRLRVRIIHVSQTKGKNLLVVSPVGQWKKFFLAKLCKCAKTLTSSPG